jgi:hypothetical protein
MHKWGPDKKIFKMKEKGTNKNEKEAAEVCCGAIRGCGFDQKGRA